MGDTWQIRNISQVGQYFAAGKPFYPSNCIKKCLLTFRHSVGVVIFCYTAVCVYMSQELDRAVDDQAVSLSRPGLQKVGTAGTAGAGQTTFG